MARVLLINPPVYDFAAYDLWARPLGLLYVAAFLESLGHEVRVVDCLDRLHEASSAAGARASRRRRHGTGSYSWSEVSKPGVYRHVPRIYRRFGLPQDAMRRELAAGARPDIIGVTSMMTYWYPGVVEAVRAARDAYPGVPVALGGVYATLCAAHAREVVRPDYLVEGRGEAAFARLVDEVAASSLAPAQEPHFARLSDPAWHLLAHFESIAVLTGRGCPYSCAYCASAILNPRIERRCPDRVVDELARLAERFRVEDAAVYDDALLWRADEHVKPILRGVIERGVRMRFHTPNGLHAGSVDDELARLMREAGFVTLRLSLETVAPERQADWDYKVAYDDFCRAVSCLKRAGFAAGELGAYVMAGAAGESYEEAARNIEAAHAAGVPVRLAQYSPIPGTRHFGLARASSTADLDEPLLHNNTVVPAAPERFEEHQRLKDLVRRLNDRLLGA